MKTRFSTIDVSAAVNDLKLMQGFRVVNVYDINHKTYIMKLSSGPEKSFILFESGIRIHRAYHDYEKGPFPSNFSVKLRKHLNNRRLTKVSQVAMDRIVDMQIDEGDRCVHVIVELYDKGNIVLTDSSYTILNILRPRTDKDKDVKFSVNQSYPLSPKCELPDLPTVEQIIELLNKCDQKTLLKKAIAVPGVLSGALLEHSLLINCIAPDTQVSAVEQKDHCAVGVVNALNDAKRIAKEICNGKSAGYVFYTTQTRVDGTEVEAFLEYHPYIFSQHQGSSHHAFGSFSEAADAYYAVIDAQRQQQAALKIEKEAMKKLDNVRRDQHRRILELEYSREEKMLMADLIIHNQTLVDSAIQVICNALAHKTNWEDVERMRMEAIEKGDSVARAIVKLDLENNAIIMRLREEPQGKSLKDVPISINTTAFGNACKMYHGMKAATEKALRTETAAQKAIRGAEEKAKATIRKVNVNASSIKIRKEMWFEKFIWFMSSEKYMVIIGRDAAQNELLVKRYLRSGDIYVHADAHGAASVIIRNKQGGGEIPPKTLTEAAQMATCFTKAWASHISSSAWWVYAWQVSKVAKSGEYLTKGSFVIRGKKNFLPSSPLVLGFGILFRVDEISAQKHQKKMKEQLLDSVVPEIDETEDFDDNALPTLDQVTDSNKLPEEHEYPDIQIDVPTVRLQCEKDDVEDYSVINFATKTRSKKQNVPAKELETKQYLEKKAEEERKAIIAKKGGKREKHKMEKIRRKYRDQDEDERETRLILLGCRGRGNQKSGDETPANNLKQITVLTEKWQSPLENNRCYEEREIPAVKKTPPEKNCRYIDYAENPETTKPLLKERIFESRGRTMEVYSYVKEVEKRELNESAEGFTEEKDNSKLYNMTNSHKREISKEGVGVNKTTGGVKNEMITDLETTVLRNFCEQNGYNKAMTYPGSDTDMVQRTVEDEEDEDEMKESVADEGTETLMAQLIPNPESDDVLICALPMVGPYQAFQNFKYKVKLTPGSGKKGKIGKMAIDLFLRMKNNEQREREFIRALASDDKTWANIPTGCRVSAPQLHAKK